MHHDHVQGMEENNWKEIYCTYENGITLTYILSLNNKLLHLTIQKRLKSPQMWLNFAIWPKTIPLPFTPYMLQQLLTLKNMSKQRTSQNTGMNNFIVKHIWSDTKNPRCHKLIWIPQNDLMWHEQLKMLEVGVMSLVDKKPKINLTKVVKVIWSP